MLYKLYLIMKQLNAYYIFILLILPCLVHGQSMKIVGKVNNIQSHRPISIASIKALDQHVETKTNDHGIFTISVKEEIGSLEISHLGFKPLRIGYSMPMSDTLSILMEPLNHELQEVLVSTGYQDISKNSSTGAFEKIDTDLLDRTVSADLLSRLNNASTGTYFHTSRERFSTVGRPANRDLSIHGVSTLYEGPGSSNAPLIILDNFPYEGDINKINPNDIESITILKDAAAASIWGAKAGNGVIVVKSKQAVYRQPVQIKFRSDFLLHTKPDLYKHKTISNSDYINVERDLFEKGFYGASENNPGRPLLSPVVELLIKGRDNELSATDMEMQIAEYEKRDIRDDFLKYMYRNSMLQRYGLELQGGSDNVKFVSGIGYDKSDAMFRGFSDDRLSFRLDNSVKLLKKIELQTGVRWIKTSERGPVSSISYSDNGYTIPYLSLINEAGSPNHIPYQYRTAFIEDASREGMLMDWRYNPIAEIQNRGKHNDADEILIQTGIHYPVSGWLNLNLRYQWNKSFGNNDILYNLDSYYARNLINRGTDVQSGKALYNFPYGAILDQYQSARTAQSGRLQADIKKQWGDIKLTGLLGADIQDALTIGKGYINYGYDPGLMTFRSNLNFSKSYPIYASLGPDEMLPFNIKESFSQRERFVSLFSNISVTYKDKYIFYGSARRDASNLFGVKTNDKWTPLWSAGGAWLLHKEKYINADWIDLLKIRASYGFSGNVNSSMSGETVLVYYNSMVPEVDYPSGGVQRPPNPTLRWEKVENLNFGIDFSFFSGKFTSSIDVYKKKTRDLISRFPLDPTTGFVSMDMNVGGTKSQGIDINISLKQAVHKIVWQGNLLFSYNNNWVTDSYVNYTGPTLLVRTGEARATAKGLQVYPAYSYRWAGLDPRNGTARGYLNGEVSNDYQKIMGAATQVEDLVYHGSARPLLFGSFRNTFSLRKMSLSANISYRFLYYFRRQGLNYAQLFYSGDGHRDYYSRWKKSGDEEVTDVPAFMYPITNANTFYQNSAVLMEPGDHIRLEDLRFSYNTNFPFAGIKNLKVYVQANNLGILWRANRLDLDPQVEGGIPLPKAYSFGVEVSF